MESIINRHIARLLDDVELLCPDINPLAKIAIKREMRFLATDIETQVTASKPQGNIKDDCQKDDETRFNR